MKRIPPDPKCSHEWLMEGTIGEQWWYCTRCKGRVAERPKR